MDMKLEVVVVPVSDVDKAKDFYQALGFRLDIDYFADIEAARTELAGRGAGVSGAFHDTGGVFHHAGTRGQVAGPDPQRRSYGSFASFSDPDGNGWLLQEVGQRAPGR
jgi:catechol 2,3-dioxygenase-like lactoylglutathione lyase family enzyme